MKTMLKIFLLSGLIVITAFGCKKDKTIKPQYNSNITLYNKPLDVIKANILGKWQLIYYDFSWIPNSKHYYQDHYTEFTSNGNRRIDMVKDSVIMDAAITWLKANDGQATGVPYGTTTFVMSYHNKYGTPFDYVVDSIFNDTLILHFNAADGFSDYYVRINQ